MPLPLSPPGTRSIRATPRHSARGTPWAQTQPAGSGCTSQNPRDPAFPEVPRGAGQALVPHCALTPGPGPVAALDPLSPVSTPRTSLPRQAGSCPHSNKALAAATSVAKPEPPLSMSRGHRVHVPSSPRCHPPAPSRRRGRAWKGSGGDKTNPGSGQDVILHPWSLGCPFPVLGVEVPGQPPDLGPPSWRRGRVPRLSPRWLLCFQAVFAQSQAQLLCLLLISLL